MPDSNHQAASWRKGGRIGGPDQAARKRWSSQPPRKRRVLGNALANVILLPGLLTLPVIAGWVASGWIWLVPIWMAFASVIAFVQVDTDKKRAGSGGWRISEYGLHTIEFLGGWPGAYLAHRTFRHKIRKQSFQVVFWCIVAVWQLAALTVIRVAGEG